MRAVSCALHAPPVDANAIRQALQQSGDDPHDECLDGLFRNVGVTGEGRMRQWVIRECRRWRVAMATPRTAASISAITKAIAAPELPAL